MLGRYLPPQPDIAAIKASRNGREGGWILTQPNGQAIDPRHSWNDARDGEIAGVRLAKPGQVSTWATLPTDGMGSIMDPMKLPDQIASMLRFIGALNLIDTERIAIGAGVETVL